METSSVSSILKEALDSALLELEKQLAADVLVVNSRATCCREKT